MGLVGRCALLFGAACLCAYSRAHSAGRAHAPGSTILCVLVAVAPLSRGLLESTRRGVTSVIDRLAVETSRPAFALVAIAAPAIESASLRPRVVELLREFARAYKDALTRGGTPTRGSGATPSKTELGLVLQRTRGQPRSRGWPLGQWPTRLRQASGPLTGGRRDTARRRCGRWTNRPLAQRFRACWPTSPVRSAGATMARRDCGATVVADAAALAIPGS